MNAGRFARLALAAMLAAVTAAAWIGYGRPDFVLWLGTSLVFCA